jgi:hypothetical protein
MDAINKATCSDPQVCFVIGPFCTRTLQVVLRLATCFVTLPLCLLLRLSFHAHRSCSQSVLLALGCLIVRTASSNANAYSNTTVADLCVARAVLAVLQRPPGGYNITVFHTMHDEVNMYRTHVWACNRCGNTVKRSMNRPPQEADCRAFTKAAAAAAAAAGLPGAYCKCVVAADAGLEPRF